MGGRCLVAFGKQRPADIERLDGEFIRSVITYAWLSLEDEKRVNEEKD